MNQPPALWKGLLSLILRPDLLEDVQGDLDEIFEAKCHTESVAHAKSWYVKEVLRLMRPRLLKSFTWQMNIHILLSNYLLVAWRSARRQSVYTSLNLLGLITGLTATLTIGLWIYDEVRKDHFHTNDERLYSLRQNTQQSSGGVTTSKQVPYAMLEVLQTEYPAVEAVAAISWPMRYRIKFDQFSSFETGRFVTRDFYHLFSYKMLAGEPSRLGIVITQSLADKLLTASHDYPSLIGETIQFYDGWASNIVGVIEDPGPRSSLQFDWLMSAEVFVKMNPWLMSWENSAFHLHFLLKETTSSEEQLKKLEARLSGEIERHTEATAWQTLWIQPYSEGYLYNHYRNGEVDGGKVQYVKILISISIFILMIAILNFINLTTAQAQVRSREIGLRKVMGAQPGNLMTQFLLEYFLMISFAMAISAFLIVLLLPFIGQLVDKDLSYILSVAEVWWFLLALLLGITVFASFYPIKILSYQRVRNAVARKFKRPKASISFRSTLVVIQLSISFLLVYGSLIVYHQLDFMLNKDTGINRKNVLAIPIESQLYEQVQVFKTSLQAIPEIKSVSGSNRIPVSGQEINSSIQWEGKAEELPSEIYYLTVTENFVQNMGIKLISGRNYDVNKYGAGDTANYLVNEAAVRLMGFRQPLGKKISAWGDEGAIIGVIKDYHFDDFDEPIYPLILKAQPNDINWVLVEFINEVHWLAALGKINALVQSIEPEHSMNYELLEDNYRELFGAEIALNRFATLFMIVSVLISIIGLYGLSSYQTERRSKEVSIRKVFGASRKIILIGLGREYLLIFSVACLIALPISIVAAVDWLNQFAFRIDLSVGHSLLAVGILLLVGMIAISYKSFQASNSSPAEILRTE